MSTERMYLIAHIGHSTKWNEHICWWKPDSRGYTICIDKAGEYSAEEARGICRTGLCIAVSKADAAAVSRSTPYYRMPNGSLARLYDGGEHRPVPNDKASWQHLLARSLQGCGKPERRTTIGAKARAIYLTSQP